MKQKTMVVSLEEYRTFDRAERERAYAQIGRYQRALREIARLPEVPREAFELAANALED